MGRAFPVEVVYSDIIVPKYVNGKSMPKYVNEAVRTILKIYAEEPEGDVLVFLTGEREIEDAVTMIEDEYEKNSKYKEAGPLRVMPLYALLSTYEQ